MPHPVGFELQMYFMNPITQTQSFLAAAINILFIFQDTGVLIALGHPIELTH